MIDLLNAIYNYFAAIIEDGDYLNDWLTHLPMVVGHIVLQIGMFLADLLDKAPLISL